MKLKLFCHNAISVEHDMRMIFTSVLTIYKTCLANITLQKLKVSLTICALLFLPTQLKIINGITQDYLNTVIWQLAYTDQFLWVLLAILVHKGITDFALCVVVLVLQ